MKEIRRILAAVLIGMVLSIGGFAQKGNNDNRPPKETPKVKERDKPPPANDNQNANKPRKP
jgi:hypothetical protein